MIQMDIEKKVITIPSDAHYIRTTSDEILNTLEQFSLDKTLVFVIKLCIEEAIRNAMVHGNRSQRELPVTVSYWVKEHRLTVEIEDNGAGFDIRKLPDPTEDNNLMKGHGRGVYLINHLMDEVRYNEKGNKVTMSKYLLGGTDGDENRE